MNEVEKMRSSQLADMSVPEIQVKFEHAKRLLAKMRVMSTYDEDYRVAGGTGARYSRYFHHLPALPLRPRGWDPAG